MKIELRPGVDYSAMPVDKLKNLKSDEYFLGSLASLSSSLLGFLSFLGFKEGVDILAAGGTVLSIAVLGISSQYFREGRRIRREMNTRAT